MKKPLRRIHFRTRQRQRMSRKTIILATASCFALMGIGLTFFMNLASNQDSRAQTGETINVIIVQDLQVVNAKSIAAPILANRPASNSRTIFIREAKPLSADSTTISQ